MPPVRQVPSFVSNARELGLPQLGARVQMSRGRAQAPKATLELATDPRNANRGTDRGRKLLRASLGRYGAGRSSLVDRHGVAIAGNKTLQQATELGLPVRLVETDGKELVVVQRRDLDLARDTMARELAVADNRVAELDLE